VSALRQNATLCGQEVIHSSSPGSGSSPSSFSYSFPSSYSAVALLLWAWLSKMCKMRKMAKSRWWMIGSVFLISLAGLAAGQPAAEPAPPERCNFIKMQDLLQELVSLDAADDMFEEKRDAIVADPEYAACVRVVDRVRGMDRPMRMQSSCAGPPVPPPPHVLPPPSSSASSRFPNLSFSALAFSSKFSSA